MEGGGLTDENTQKLESGRPDFVSCSASSNIVPFMESLYLSEPQFLLCVTKKCTFLLGSLFLAAQDQP